MSKLDNLFSKLYHGYKQEWFIDKIEDNYLCSICREIVRNPLNLSCPHLVCQLCINRSVKNECPECREKFIPNKSSVIKFIQQNLSTKKIKCIFNDKGCKWVGTIGTNERNLGIHLSECEYNCVRKCKYCSKKINIYEEDEHDAICLDKEVECEHCNQVFPRKLLFIHKSIGENNFGYCENKTKCIYEDCVVKIEKNKLKEHINNECEYRKVPCCFCPTTHLIEYYKFNEHVKDKLTPENILRVTNKFIYDFNMEGAIVEINTLRNDCKLAEVISINNDDIFTVRILDDNTISRFPKYDIKLPSYKFIRNNYEIKDNVLNCLKRFECTISEVPNGTYEIQPFYQCLTCNPLNNSIDGLQEGFCAVCAITCHHGHNILLTDSANNYCDCGDGSMVDVNKKRIVCCAPKTKKISTLNTDYKNNDIKTEISVRHNGEVSIDFLFPSLTEIYNRDANYTE